MSVDHPTGAGEYLDLVDHPLAWFAIGMAGLVLAVAFFHWLHRRQRSSDGGKI